MIEINEGGYKMRLRFVMRANHAPGPKISVLLLLAAAATGCATASRQPNAVTGLVGTYVFAPPSECILQPADQQRICLLGPDGSNGGVVLDVARERMTPAEASSRSKGDWEAWMLGFQMTNELLAGIEVVSGRHVDEDAFAARIGAEACLALYSHLRAAGLPDSDDAAITCVFVDREGGRVDLVGVDYTEFRHDPRRENGGFAERATPVLHSLRRATAS